MTMPVLFDLYGKDEIVLATINLALVDFLQTNPSDSYYAGNRNYVKVTVTAQGRCHVGYVQQAKLNKIRYIYGLECQAQKARLSLEILKGKAKGVKENQ